jgi:serine/threonine protein kinase
MLLTADSHLGPYQIIAAIGSGGMGEVYRARDTRLKRDVALKILPESFASNPERLARFQREAEVLASLNHPNIAAIYGVEESNSTRALVMELVEGETLAERIARGPIPIDEALPIAKQIAEALETAHEQGVVHRDLKPANIKVTPSGQVKVLDFGLAKLAEPSAAAGTAPSPLSLSPTITSPALMTGMGVLLGTAAYMSPEQARGKPADRRSDIWAFGCVLFEMLTGSRPFDGTNATEVFARILEREPAWSALPVSTPVGVQALLKRCLAKDRTQRLDSAAVARLEIDELASGSPPDTVGRRVIPRLQAVGIVAVSVGLTAVTMWTISQRNGASRSLPVRFEIDPPAGQSLWADNNTRNAAISPDGTRVVYVTSSVASGQTQLLMRRLDDLSATILPGTTDARNPFWSPDSQWVAFFAGDEIKRLSVTGGAPISIYKFLLSANSGSRTPSGTWGNDDTILFSTGGNNAPLQRVAATGGKPTIAVQPNTGNNEQTFISPTSSTDLSLAIAVHLHRRQRLHPGALGAHVRPRRLGCPSVHSLGA